MMRTSTIAGRIELSQAVAGFWSLAPRQGRYRNGKLRRPGKGEEAVWVIRDGVTLYAIVSLETGEDLFLAG